MQRHQLKTDPAFFRLILAGKKSYELRENDRNFRAGDEVILEEYFAKTNEYSGRKLIAEVTFVLKDYPGIERGYCILSLKIINPANYNKFLNDYWHDPSEVLRGN